MKSFFVLLVCIFMSCDVFGAITIEDIVNFDGWKQEYSQQTLKPCADDLSMLCHNKSKTGLKLKKPALPGDKIVLHDSTIPKRTYNRKPAGGTGGNSSGGTGGNSGGGGNGINAGTVLKSTAQVAGGLVLGAEGVDITTGANAANTEKKTWGDVATSAAGTAMTVGGAAAIINAIPAFGQVTYVGAIAAGAAIGTFATGRKMFSETDCNKDPVRGFYACCNISNLSNIQAYRAEIGQEMWTENFPYVSTCMQGNKPFEADSWLEQRFLDDAWSDPVKRLCAGFVEPTDIAHVLPTGYDPDGDGKDICWGWTCEEGYKVSGTVCVPGNGDDDNGPKPPRENNCREGRTSAEGKACCDLPSSVATWDGSKCNCLGGKKFEINNGTGQCVVAGGNDEDMLYECSSFDVSLINSWKVECKDNLTVMQLIQNLELMCKNKSLTVVQFNRMSNEVSLSVERNCKSVVMPDSSQSRAAIIAAGGVLDGIVSGFDVSVWKDQEGNFNTARLASDSIAGVVLGTAGGLISSHVIKKSQIKKGFEDIQCVIAGQPVAGWGDLFQVGIQ